MTITMEKKSIEKCSICPWSGEDAVYEERFPSNRIQHKLGLLYRKTTLKCCPRCGGIVQSEFERAKKRKINIPPTAKEVRVMEKSTYKKGKSIAKRLSDAIPTWLKYTFFSKHGKR